MQDNQTESVGEQVVTGGLWLGAWRWTARLIGFFTTIFLARVLVPEDFGILATGTIVVGFFSIFVGLGADSYLIRHENPDRDDYDTAWTLRILVISIASICVFLAAQPGADYFGDQRLVDILQVLAIVGWLGGFSNIGFTMYRRDLKFRIIALIGISKRISASIVTVGLAVWLENYWAMVIGDIVFILLGLLLSYTHHSYRPRFTLVRFREQWDFSKWIVVQNIASFLQRQGDSFLVVKFFGIEQMGLYAMAARLAAMPTRQVIGPALTPIFSGLAKKQADPEAFSSSILKVTGATAALMLPAATLFVSLSEVLITTILGDRWLLASPLVAPITISILLAVLMNPAGAVLTIKGRVKQLAGLNWLSVIVVICTMLIAVQWHSMEILVWSRVGVIFLFLMINYAYMLAVTGVSLKRLTDSIYRSLAASAVMALVIYLLSLVITADWLLIIAGTIMGGSSYLLALFLFWKTAGSPDSGEAFIVRKLFRVIVRKLGK